MRTSVRGWLAVAALGAIAGITAAWWALALWPVDDGAPGWLLRTREVCFGSTADRLPNGGGWLLLIGQPAGMVGLLAAVWGTELRQGLRRVLDGIAGQLAVGAISAALVAGLAGVVVRVSSAGSEPFSTGAAEIAPRLTRVNDAAPAMALTDQYGQAITLDTFRGRPVLVAFAYAHCQTICPLIVSDVLAARARLGDPPPALVITMDPWRDTPARLPAIAEQWKIGGQAHVLSGEPEVVERTLNAWRVPRARNEKTGDISHPYIVYVLGRDGRIAFVVNGGPDAIVAAVNAL
ncbi:MAG TPA: SCO family protein [Vicinamibacterales bacterium]|nr:SCO family protein [Vicinamibacterales bacterium]